MYRPARGVRTSSRAAPPPDPRLSACSHDHPATAPPLRRPRSAKVRGVATSTASTASFRPGRREEASPTSAAASRSLKAAYSAVRAPREGRKRAKPS